MGQEQDPPAVRVLAQRETLAALAGAIQIAVSDERHVAGFRNFRQWIGLRSGQGGDQ